MEHGANENLADKEAKLSPFHIAMNSGRPELMKRMVKNSYRLDTMCFTLEW
jgi:hypothetical protein